MELSGWLQWSRSAVGSELDFAADPQILPLGPWPNPLHLHTHVFIARVWLSSKLLQYSLCVFTWERRAPIAHRRQCKVLFYVESFTLQTWQIWWKHCLLCEHAEYCLHCRQKILFSLKKGSFTLLYWRILQCLSQSSIYVWTMSQYKNHGECHNDKCHDIKCHNIKWHDIEIMANVTISKSWQMVEH